MTEDTDRPCITCAYLIPDTSTFGFARRSWYDWISGKERQPSAGAYCYAYCGRTLLFAKVERETKCLGKFWEAKK